MVSLGGGNVSGPGASGWASDVSIAVEYEFVDEMEGTPLHIVARHCSRSRITMRASIVGATLSLPGAGASTTGSTVSFSGAGGSVSFQGALESISHKCADGQISSTDVTWVGVG